MNKIFDYFLASAYNGKYANHLLSNKFEIIYVSVYLFLLLKEEISSNTEKNWTKNYT